MNYTKAKIDSLVKSQCEALGWLENEYSPLTGEVGHQANTLQ